MLAKDNPDLLEAIKIVRMERAKKRKGDNVHSRLIVKEKVAEKELKKLVRIIEKNY